MSNSTNTLTDKKLVEKVLHGDTNAFSIVIKNTEALVAQIVYKMISNAEDRKDLAQDIYLKAYKSLPAFRFGAKLSTWIGQIAYNACTDYLRRKKLVLAETVFEDDHPDEAAFGAPALRIEPEAWNAHASLSQKQRAEILNRAIEKLSPLFKTLICLYHQEELSYNEIAAITQLPEGTIKSYLFRARKNLKDNLLVHYKKEEL